MRQTLLRHSALSFPIDGVGAGLSARATDRCGKTMIVEAQEHLLRPRNLLPLFRRRNLTFPEAVNACGYPGRGPGASSRSRRLAFARKWSSGSRFKQSVSRHGGLRVSSALPFSGDSPQRRSKHASYAARVSGTPLYKWAARIGRCTHRAPIEWNPRGAQRVWKMRAPAACHKTSHAHLLAEGATPKQADVRFGAPSFYPCLFCVAQAQRAICGRPYHLN